MKKTKCPVCGEDAFPLYIRTKVDGEESKGVQFCRAGTWCMNRDCDSIHTDEGIYRKVPPDPVEEAKNREMRLKADREEFLNILLEPDMLELIRRRLEVIHGKPIEMVRTK